MMRKTLVALMAVGALGVSSAALGGGGHGHGGSSGGGGSGGGSGGSAMSHGSMSGPAMSHGSMSGPAMSHGSMSGHTMSGKPGWGSPTMRSTNIGTTKKTTNIGTTKKGWGATNIKSPNTKSANIKAANIKAANIKNVHLTGQKKSVFIFRNHHHRRVFVDVAFFGVFADFPSCWQWSWTPWGWQRVFVCDVPGWAWG
jgi:hypothetical protein